MVESTIVLSVAAILLLGFIELGITISRKNTLCESARRGARALIVRGSKASDLGAIGSTTQQFTADNSNAIASSFRFLLATMDPKDVNVTVEWLDGDNEIDQKIRVTVSYLHKPIVPLVYGFGNRTLQASATMAIAH